MSLIKCPACDNQVSTQAKSCPQCGHPLKPTPSTPPPQSKESQGLGFWGVVGAVVVAIIILSFI